MNPGSCADRIPVRLERTMLFVPAAKFGIIEKAAASVADAVCIDLEDSVASDQKAPSRAYVARAFNELEFGRRTRIFRINGLDTSFAYRDLIEVVEAAGANIDLVMVPKVNSPEDLTFVDTLLSQIEAYCHLTRRIGIEAQIETAAGFLWIREIAQSTSRLETLIFGPGDYAASMQMPSAGIGEFDQHDDLYPGHRWHSVMHAIVAAARANGLRCIDGPFADYKDSTALDRFCRIARAMGFDGKQCIHPNQLPTANAVFSPADEDIAHAEKVVHALEQAAAENSGVVGIDGKMVDAASIRMAQTILRKRQLITGKQDE